MPATNSVCVKGNILGEDYLILSKASGIAKANWFRLAVFIVMSAFFVWVSMSSVNTIYKVYTQYKENVRYRLQEVDGYLQDPTNPAYDNEVYDNPGGKTDPLYNDNAYIRKSINQIRKRYQQYNVELRKSEKAEDVVDDTIVADDHDDYSSKKK